MHRTHSPFFVYLNFSTFLIFIISGCSYKKEKITATDHPLEKGVIRASALSYDLVKSFVIGPYCVSCHGNSGGVYLGSYEAVLRHLPAVERTAIHELTMPPASPLSLRQREVLQIWIEAGAPLTGKEEGPTTPPEDSPTPPPTLPPLEATFSSLKTHIFVPKCLICHSSRGSARNISLATREDLLSSPLELVIPGNSEESGLTISVIREDGKRMPPPDSGFSPLKEEEIDAIKRWIDEGAEK